jgi:hypothetical protein
MFFTVMEAEQLIRNAQLQDTVNCNCIYTCTLHDVMEINNTKPRQNSVVWRAAECHCQAVGFLLRNYSKIKININLSHFQNLTG